MDWTANYLKAIADLDTIVAGIGQSGLGGILSGSLGGQALADPATQQALHNQSDAQRIYSGIVALRESKQQSTSDPAPHVETVERLPRVIELEAEIE